MTEIVWLLADNPFGIMYILPFFSAVLAGYFLFKSKKSFASSVVGLEKRAVIAIGIIAIGYLLFIIPGLEIFVPSDEEWMGLKQARELINGDLSVFNHSQKGIGYVLAVSGVMMLFGQNEQAAAMLNVGLASVTIALVGLTAYVISRKSSAAVASSLAYATLPLVVQFTSFKMGYPTLGGFFMALFSFIGVVLIKERSTTAYVTLWLVLALAAQVKPEFSVLFIPATALGFYLFRDIRAIVAKSIKHRLFVALSVIAIGISLIPFVVKNHQYNQGLRAVNGLTGLYQTQRADYPEANDILRRASNGRLSFIYWWGDVGDLFSFAAGLQKGTFFGVILMGMIVMMSAIKRNRDEMFGIIFLFGSAIVVLSIYMAADVFLIRESGRFVFYSLPILAPIFGICLVLISEFIGKTHPFLLPIPYLLLIVYAINVSFDEIPRMANELGANRYLMSVPQVKPIAESGDFDKSEVVFYTKQTNVINFLRFRGYRGHAFNDSNVINSGSSPDPKEVVKNLELPDWNSGLKRVMVVVPGDDIMNDELSSETIRLIIETQAVSEKEFSSGAKTYILK